MWIENGTGTYEALTFWLFCAVKRSRCHTCQTAILINSDRPLFLLTFPPRARRTSERIYVRKKCVEHTWRVGCWAGAGYVLHSYFRLAWGLMHTWHNNHYSFINVYSGVRTTPACYVLCERATTSYGCFCVLCVRALLRCRKTFTTTAYEYCTTKQQEVPVYVVGYTKEIIRRLLLLAPWEALSFRELAEHRHVCVMCGVWDRFDLMHTHTDDNNYQGCTKERKKRPTGTLLPKVRLRYKPERWEF